MSLSRIAVEQREKEAKNLNSLLAFSLIGSLALHIGVLSLGIGKFLSKVPEPENEPIEIAIAELPNPQKLESKLEQAKGDSVAGNNQALLSNSGSSQGFGVASGGGASLPKKIATSEILKPQPAAQQKLSQRISKVNSPPPQNQKIKLEKVPAKIVAPSQAVPITTSSAASSAIVTKLKPIIPPAPIPIATATPTGANPLPGDRSSQIQELNNQKLNRLLANAKNTREQTSKVTNSAGISDRQNRIAANLRNQPGSGVGTSNGVGNSLGNESRSNGTGNGTNTNNGTNGNVTRKGAGNGTNTNNSGTGNGNNGLQNGSTVATGAQNIERRTSPVESSTNPKTGSSGRLACRTCSKPKYPESARKRRLEGKAEISVDVDSKGNVTNVRLARTSGHSELDKAAIEQARSWKFNAPNGAAQGVIAKVDFAIEGSKKSRQNRERRRQRAAARQQPVASSQNTPIQPSTPTNNVTRTPARRNSNTTLKRSLRRQTTIRRVDTLPPRQAYDQPQLGSQTRLRDTLKRSQSSNQTKLRQSLRLYQQKSPSTPSNEP